MGGFFLGRRVSSILAGTERARHAFGKREKRDMKKRAQRAAQQAKSVVEDAFGLPPAKTPSDRDEPQRDPNAPSGSLSSDGEKVIAVDFSIPMKGE